MDTTRSQHLSVLMSSALVAFACTEQADAPVTQPSGTSEITHGALTLTFPEALTSETVIEFARADASFSFGLAQVRFSDASGHFLSASDLGMAPRKIEGRQIRYEAISGGIDLVFERESDQLRQWLVLRDRSMLPTDAAAATMEVVETVDFSGLEVTVDGVAQTLPLVANTTGAIRLAKNGRAMFVIPKPVVRVGAPKNIELDEASYELRLDATGKGVLATRVPLSLLRNPRMPYPLMIDPPVGIVCGHGDGPGDAADLNVDCNDGSDCTVDTCVIEAGDIYGTCVYTAQNIGSACGGTGTCGDTGDCISSVPSVRCNDGSPCTTDGEDAAGECTHVATNDGASCYAGWGRCNAGACEADPQNCQDDNPCTTDSWDGSACQHLPVADATACWTTGACLSGECNYEISAAQAGCQLDQCDDGTPCTNDVCQADGECTHTPTNFFNQTMCWTTGICSAGPGNECVFNNLPPTAVLTAAPVSMTIGVNTGETLNFDGSMSGDPEDDIAEYRFDFGDGNQTAGTDATASHSYATTGDYEAVLTVIDGANLGDQASLTVNVCSCQNGGLCTPKGCDCTGTGFVGDDCSTPEPATATVCSTPNAPIPADGSTQGTTDDVLGFMSGGTMTDVNVSVNISHTFSGDLQISLQHAGAEVMVYNGNCGGSADVNLAFDDEATTSITCPSIGAEKRKPQNPLSLFDGLDRGGDWTLHINDRYSADLGTLIEWCVEATN